MDAMEQSIDQDSFALAPTVGPGSSNFTAEIRAPVIANTSSLPHTFGIRHSALSGESASGTSTSVENPEEESSSFSYISVEVHYTLLLFIMVSSVAINGLVFVLFYQRPSVRMPSNKFVLNMAIVHLLQTFIVLPFVFVSVVFQEWIFGDVFCKIHGALSVCLTMANVFSILLIAVDRNCAVNSPLHYSMTITKKRTSALIVSTWVFAVVIAIPPLAGVSDLQYQKSWAMCTVTWYDTGLLTLAYSCIICVLGFLLPFIRITWIYTSMFQAARRNSACTRLRNIKSGSSEITPPSSAGPDGGSSTPASQNRKPARSKRATYSQVYSLFGDKLKAVRTGVFVVVSFTACFLPFFAMTVVEPHALTLKTPLHNLPAVAMLLLFSSSLINPYLYVIRNKATRKHVRKMFKCLRRKPSFFSPLGYHHSHQSPLQERQCSEGTRVLESSVSLHSGGPEEYQRSLMSRSFPHNSGEWSVVAVTADPNTSRSRRSSLPVRRPTCFDEMEEEPLQLFQYYPSYQHHKNMPVRYNVNVRSSVYRRASLDNGKVPSQRTLRTSEQCVMRTYATARSPGDRCKSFRIRGRYANRKELTTATTAYDRSYNTNVNREERRRYFSDSYQHRRGRDVRHDSEACVSILNRGAEIHRAPLHYANSMARVQRFGSVPSESRSSEASGRACLPVLVRGQSIAIDEREMGTRIPAQAISQSGSLRKTQFAMGRRSPKQSSSETNTTTLESLTSTESQELPIISSPRTLSPTSITSYRYPHVQTYQQYQRQCWRQQAYSSVPPPTTIPCQQLHRHTEVPQDCQDRRDSGFEDTMLERYDLCCTVEGECSSIRAMKFLEHV